MQSHHYNVTSLFESYLAGDQRAHMLLEMYIDQQELTQQEIETISLQLNSEVSKSDDSCNHNALVLRGFLFQKIDKNDEQAIHFYERAMALRNANAINHRACMHREGLGGQIDYPAAIALYEQAIKLGHANAMNNLAFMYSEGLGCPVDYPTAIALYEEAIKLGHANAMYNRACMHQYGEGGGSVANL